MRAPVSPTLLIAEAPRAKTGRTRYLRHFPERLTYMLDQLTPSEFYATCRLQLAYVIADGDLPDDERRLAALAKVAPKAWLALREKLLLLGLGRVEAGQWIDDDQLANLQVQRRVSEKGRLGATRRWGARDAA